MLLRHLVMTIAVVSIFSDSYLHAENRTVARLFWQDHENATLMWGNLQKTDEGYSLSENKVEGFPALDVDEQSLVQMQSDDGLIVVGVRDEAGGEIGSGWVAIESGAVREEHGDHYHWRFPTVPAVHTTRIDASQGNPAHVYHYDDAFVMANDQHNGFTMLTAKSIRESKSPETAGRFISGGGGHITLAVADGKVAYSTWIDREGENAGRVDVVGLGEQSGKKYRLDCPTGSLHGATYNSGKVFFAPSDGICWVNADLDLNDDPKSVAVNHLEIGTDADGKPFRTGAFKNLGRHVIFSSGKADQSRLCFVDASKPEPTIETLMLEMSEQQSMLTPIVGTGPGGSPIALCFAESKDTPENDQLWVVDLDPDGDGKFCDAKAREPIAVGRSRIEGHFGHHDAVFLPRGRQIAVTNPGDSSIWIISLRDQSVITKFDCKGTPTSLISISD
ncbi:hypothetical protein [Aporhodopirellula aestuarii]|uniref:Uncharacterized protein n=1 Tax=Aporhodopirellula aestuarii TaxID=2950107 RepID=A0ABT0U8G8_9BACT|nr:hypothetical protein [Aporhodopirellula aestuarii]MCM2373220.1 hypothetical protein [Aporhodopirellula aestuarii]